MTSTLSSVQVAVASVRAMEALDPDACRATVHPEAVNREAAAEPPACRVPGPDGFFATARWLHDFASDVAWDVHEAIAEGDLVALHVTMRGTQSGEHTVYDAAGELVQRLPASGRPFAVTQTHWFRLRDGLVVEHWANRDDLTMGMQLGWFGPPA